MVVAHDRDIVLVVDTVFELRGGIVARAKAMSIGEGGRS
jgi:hypothetical protein